MSPCPACKSPAPPRSQNRAFPFCSPRCRAIDLGKWFTGTYAVPGHPAAPGEGAPGTEGPGPGSEGDSN